MGSNNTRLSPRQKMINLMYIVLTAMLALNVSSDVLNGFTQVEEGLKRTNNNVEQRNAAILNTLEEFADRIRRRASGGMTRPPTCAVCRLRSTPTSTL